MARNLNMAFFVAMAAAAMVMNSAVAATTYQVGDATGWAVPSGGAATYTTWAANKTFTVGDILVFNFLSNAHDVAEVTKTAYDSCTVTNPIFLNATSPASIVLGSTGEKYYICTFNGHCSSGQKLTITVTGASSPAPAPSTTTPSPTPSPPAPVPAPAPSTSTPTPASAPTPSSSAPTPSSTPTPSSSAPTPSSSPATPPSSPPAPSGTTTPPPGTTEGPPAPPPSAAVSLGSAGLAGTFLSIALFLLY